MVMKNERLLGRTVIVRRFLVPLLILAVLISGTPLAVKAEVTPPITLGAPEYFGVSNYRGDSVYFTFTAPEDLRDYIEKWKMENPENHKSLTVNFQIDYKIDNGSWHHTSDWDSPKTVPDGIDDMYFSFGYENRYTSSERWSMTSLFPNDASLKPFYESGWDYLKDHSITFRARFTESFDNGETFVLSPWSSEFTLSTNVKADYNKLINHAPSLASSELKTSAGGEPYFYVNLGRTPGEIQELHAMSGSSVRTEIWMRRAGENDFKYIHYEWANAETFMIDASDYFSVDNSKQSYDAESYEIKIRYALDLRNYKQSGFAGNSTTVDIYSPFSNVISHNMPAWSNASQWATAELKKADDEGLIPEILKGADLTKPITREEFCELALLLYEKSTGKTPAPASPNPFTDTNNQRILKAFALGITAGTSLTTFSPKTLINREQCATMLFRTIMAISPGGNYSVDGIPNFPDQKDISSYAVNATKFMSKLGIIKGDSKGYFMPKATTTAQTAAGYGMATREAAILMSVRTYEQVDSIKSASEESTSPEVPAVEPEKTGDLAKWLIGFWGYSDSNGNVNFDVMYEFKEDGTFYKIASTMVLGARNGNEFKGKYRISGNKLILSDQLKSTGPASSYDFNIHNIWYLKMDSYETRNVSVEDTEYQISSTDNGKLMIGDTEYNRGR